MDNITIPTQVNQTTEKLVKKLTDQVSPLDLDQVLASIPDSTEFVLLGENTHGTEEFYAIRAELTKRLILEKGFSVILVEGDWLSVYQLNKYISGSSSPLEEAFSDFKRYPRWMWRNLVFKELITWLRDYNSKLDPESQQQKVRLLGLDCYQFLESFRSLLSFLDRVEPLFSQQIRQQIGFLAQYQSVYKYAQDMAGGKLRPYAIKIQNYYHDLLGKLQWDKFEKYLQKCLELGMDPMEAVSAEQCCSVMIGADDYYQKQILEPPGSNASWNARDQHMTMTAMRLREQISLVNASKTEEKEEKEKGETQVPKMILWAHNSHVGSSLAGARGGQTFTQNEKWNLGQMIRSVYNGEGNQNSVVKIIGFYSFSGTVRASPKWGEPDQVFELNPPAPDSWEEVSHRVCQERSIDTFYIDFRTVLEVGESDENLRLLLESPRLQRWIGVVYAKESEPNSHWGEIKISQAYDGMIFVDQSEALKI